MDRGRVGTVSARSAHPSRRRLLSRHVPSPAPFRSDPFSPRHSFILQCLALRRPFPESLSCSPVPPAAFSSGLLLCPHTHETCRGEWYGNRNRFLIGENWVMLSLMAIFDLAITSCGPRDMNQSKLIRWINGRYNVNLYDSDTPVKNFLLLWNLLENDLFANHFNIQAAEKNSTPI